MTFLFTDVEGSTRQWESHPDLMKVAMARHDELIGAALGSHGGYVFSTAGDAFSVAFARVGEAVDAALAIQKALAAEPWPEPVDVKVRMGLHTGEADERNGDYFGPAVNRAARVADAGHGGQILLSDVTASMVEGHALVDLGDHRLKSLVEPIRLHQLTVDGGPVEFPPVRSVGAKASTIRPARSSLIGRVDEVETLIGLVAEHRLVTLTGAGGSGKTRLALEVGNRLVQSTNGGVYFVDLSRISDEEMVAPATAEGLDLSLTPSVAATDAVQSFLTDRDALVVLDNCEHVIDEVAAFADGLLTSCSRLRIVATSREPLEVDGERTVRVGGLSRDEAIALFRDRGHGPAVAEADEETIAEIGRRLDGLPLAIELAAARTSVLSVEEIRSNLDDRFALLTGGRRRTRGRQQTLQATVEWSYDLLEPIEQQALRALSVMPGSFGLELAAGVLGLTTGATVSLLDGLAARSLIQSDVGSGDATERYRLLETIRAFTADRLRADGEDQEVRRRYASSVVEGIGDNDIAWFARSVTVGPDDVLAVLDWAESQDDLELGSELVWKAFDALGARGAFDRVEEVAAWLATTSDPELLARALSAKAFLEMWAFKVFESMSSVGAAVDAAPDSVGAAVARVTRALLLCASDPQTARADLEAAAEILTDRGTPTSRFYLGWMFGVVDLAEGDLDRAAEKARSLLRGLDLVAADLMGRSMLLTTLALSRANDEIAEILAVPFGGLGRQGSLERTAGPTLLATDGVALATIGRVADARRHLARLWDDREDVWIPGLNGELGMALVACCVESDELDEARALLAVIGMVRFAHSFFYLFMLEHRLNGIDTDDLGVRLSITTRRVLDGAEPAFESKLADAIEGEFRRLGLR